VDGMTAQNESIFNLMGFVDNDLALRSIYLTYASSYG
jgi:hypothetical protein